MLPGLPFDQQIAEFVNEITKYSRIKIIVSCRNEYYKEHFHEYALWGVGLYYKPILKQWYADSSLIASMPNVHNSFLEYWIKGGIFGLGLIVSLFAFPVVRMKRRKQWSLIALGGIAAIFIASNTCVLFVHNNSLTIILFWLSAFYFYLKEFTGLEREP